LAKRAVAPKADMMVAQSAGFEVPAMVVPSVASKADMMVAQSAGFEVVAMVGLKE
jgi:hypothetical protein